MIIVTTRKQNYTVDADFNEFCEELNSNKTPYIQVNNDLIRKSEITSAKKDGTQRFVSQLPENTHSQAEREENIYVYTYMKAHMPGHIKKLGRRLKTDEIQAIIAEARVAYSDA